MENKKYIVEYKPTLREKCRRYLFPYSDEFDERTKFRSRPDGSYHPGITVVTKYYFSLDDRIRLLFGGRLEVKNVINCEVDPGRTDTRTFTQIL